MLVFLPDDRTETLEAGVHQTGTCHFPLVHNRLPGGGGHTDFPFTKATFSTAEHTEHTTLPHNFTISQFHSKAVYLKLP